MKTFSKDSVLKNLPELMIWHEDKAHGWLEVPYRLLVKLGIHIYISEYSYRNGNITYLEEDSDAYTFIEAYFKFFDLYSDTMNYESYWRDKVLTSYQEVSFVRSFQHFYLD